MTDYVLSPAQVTDLMANSLPQFTSQTYSLGPAVQNVPFVDSLAGLASDTDGSVTYGKANGPSWLNVAANGSLLGTPTAANQGDNEFVVTATDSSGALTYAVVTIPVAASSSAAVTSSSAANYSVMSLSLPLASERAPSQAVENEKRRVGSTGRTRARRDALGAADQNDVRRSDSRRCIIRRPFKRSGQEHD